jgi:hypothetical protein
MWTPLALDPGRIGDAKVGIGENDVNSIRALGGFPRRELAPTPD